MDIHSNDIADEEAKLAAKEKMQGDPPRKCIQAEIGAEHDYKRTNRKRNKRSLERGKRNKYETS